MKYYLAIDIGASSGRHILAHIENGKMVTEEIYRFQNGPETLKGYDGEDHLKWTHERLFAEILNGLKKAGELGKIPYSVGIDTWGVDYALLDENDEAIGGTYCYRDHRTEKTIPAVHEAIAFEKLFEKTGIAFASFNTVYQLLDDKRTGRMEKAKNFLMLPDYFHFRLTGVKKQEYTNATTTGMVNAVTHQWDEEILDTLGYKKELFGELSQPGTEVGEFTDEVAAFVGYKAKVVLPATHDTASAVLAAPLQGQTPYISSGTWSLLGVEQNCAHTSKEALDAGYSNEGSVKQTFRLQINIMGLWMIQQVRHELDDKYSFAELAELARANPVPYEINVNDQRFLAPKSMIEEINGAVGKQLSVGEMAYVIFNNLAKYYDASLQALEGVTGEKYQTLNIIGGGSKNELLNELTAKYTGKKIITGPTEGTAIGNFMMQMVGSGELESVAEGREMIKKSFDINEPEYGEKKTVLLKLIKKKVGKEENTMSRFEEAKKIYASHGVDVESAMERLAKIPVSVHCWQGDDVIDFDGSDSLSGGIQTTGNYPGRARNAEELFADMTRAFKLMPGKKRVNVHACYAILGEDKGKVDRDQYTYKYFEPWVKWAKENGLDGVDFNPTFFGHPMMKDGLSLSSPDEETRRFWIAHGKACLQIAAEMGKAMGSPCAVNLWIPDGYKDIPADRLGPRQRLVDSLDQILADYDKEWVIPAVESKVFGIGIESYTVGSNEFYQNYAATRGICCLLDTGHYHPTEVVSDKIPSLLAFYDKVQLHVSRPVRWDSDHVIVVDDELKELSKEIIRNDAEGKVMIGLDYFDASINRLCAWVTGVRSMQKSLLTALLQPYAEMKKLQDENNLTKVLYMHERVKFLPVSDIWDEYLRRQGLKEDWYDEIEKFENEVIANRK